MSYSIDLREKVVAFVDSGSSVIKAAEIFQIGTTTIHSWRVKKKAEGNLGNKPLNRPHKKISPEVLRALIAARPDMYLREIAEEFNCCTNAISKALRRLNITRKKRVQPTERRA